MMQKAGFVRTGVAVLLAAGVSALMPALSAQRPVALVPLEQPQPPAVVDGLDILHVQGQVYMVAGAGGNVTLQVGEEGVFVADTGAPGQSDRILEVVQQLSRRPIRFMVNLNANPDHVAGNQAMVDAGNGFRGNRPATVVGGGAGNVGGANVGVQTISHERVLSRMIDGGMSGDALPISTFFGLKKEFFANGEPVQLLYQPAAHSDGDILAYFRRSDVVAVGDVFVPHAYPVIDVDRGGSVNGLIDALNNIIDITIPERNQMGGTRVIPGHGRLANEADVVDYRDMVTIVRDRVQEMIGRGMTLDQIRATGVTLEYDGYYGAESGPSSPAAFLESIYRSLGGR